MERKKSARSCTICGKTAAPYKCPRCRAKYCSVTCSGAHKNQCVSAINSSISEEKPDTTVVSISDLPSATEGNHNPEIAIGISDASCGIPRDSQDTSADIILVVDDKQEEKGERLIEEVAVAVTVVEKESGSGSSGSSSAGGGGIDVENITGQHDILSREEVQALLKSSALKSVLKNKRLRDDILKIENSGNRQSALKKLRIAKPEFNEFVSKMLSELPQ